MRLAHEAHFAELMKKEEERKRKHEEEEAAAAAKKKALEEARRLYTPSYAVTCRYLPSTYRCIALEDVRGRPPPHHASAHV